MLSTNITTMSKTTIISLEGNIGAGKSTLLKRIDDAALLARRLRQPTKHRPIVFLPESVDEWETIRDDNQNTILTNFYADPSKYAFPIQIMAYASQVNVLHRAMNRHPAIILTERSQESNHEIFTKMLRDDGHIDDLQYQIYKLNARTYANLYKRKSERSSTQNSDSSMYEDMEKNNKNDGDVPTVTDAVIYLRTTPETCLDRIQQRNRQGENQITFDYLQKCHDQHEAWLKNIPSDRCLILDADQDISFYQLCEILDFMDSTANHIRVSTDCNKPQDNIETAERKRADIFGW